MILSEQGESRVRGYLFVLGRSLRSFLPEAVVVDSLREIESHVRERVESTEPVPDERVALENVLAELGPPLRVAQAYSAEMVLEKAVATGGVTATLRAIWHLATSSILGFVAALGLFASAALGFAFLAVAIAKPIFPDRVGFTVVNGIPHNLGILADLPPGAELYSPIWLIPACIVAGLALLVLSYRGARRLLAWWRTKLQRSRRVPAIPGDGPLVRG